MNRADLSAVWRAAGAWWGITFAAAFSVWAATSTPEAFMNAHMGLARYIRLLLFFAPAVGITVAVFYWAKAEDWVLRIGVASLTAYVSGFAVTGWQESTWLAATLPAGCLVLLRKWRTRDPSALVVLHSMVTVSSFYLIYSVERYWPGRELLVREFVAFWRLIAGL